MDLKTYKQVLSIEMTIANRGTLTRESLVSIGEYRPWIFNSLADHLDVERKDLEKYVTTNAVSSLAYFYVLTMYRIQVEPRIGLFSEQVIYD